MQLVPKIFHFFALKLKIFFSKHLNAYAAHVGRSILLHSSSSFVNLYDNILEYFFPKNRTCIFREFWEMHLYKSGRSFLDLQASPREQPFSQSSFLSDPFQEIREIVFTCPNASCFFQWFMPRRFFEMCWPFMEIYISLKWLPSFILNFLELISISRCDYWWKNSNSSREFIMIFYSFFLKSPA